MDKVQYIIYLRRKQSEYFLEKWVDIERKFSICVNLPSCDAGLPSMGGTSHARLSLIGTEVMQVGHRVASVVLFGKLNSSLKVEQVGALASLRTLSHSGQARSFASLLTSFPLRYTHIG